MSLRNKICGGIFFVVLFFGEHTFYAKKSVIKKQDAYKNIIDKYKEIKIEDICLDNKNIKQEDFLFGAAVSGYQVEGPKGAIDKKYNQWLDIVGKKVEIEVSSKKEIKIIQEPGNACESWDRYKEDIKLIKAFGGNAYRFSISWGKVMPKEGECNQKVLDHYEDVCKELQKNNIQPVITLYHYAHPLWFDKKGAFEKHDNIKHFVNYGINVFKRLNKYNPLWFTINTFSGASLHAYYVGTKPPFKKDMGLALEVLKNLLDAHVVFYRKAKEQKDKVTKKLVESKIGIHKIVFPIEKYRSWQFWDDIGISFANKVNSESIYEFFTKGKLDIKIGIPALYMKDSISHENSQAIGALDCVGLNYYSGACMSNFKVLPHRNYIPTQSSLMTIYPEGFYKALHQVNDLLIKPLADLQNKVVPSKLVPSKVVPSKVVPIYITENGIATQNAEHRDVYYRSHLNILSKVMKEGVDVRGYIVWSLMDAFDWMEGYDFNFGLYAVDRDTQKRILKDGTDFFVDVIKKHSSKKVIPVKLCEIKKEKDLIV